MEAVPHQGRNLSVCPWVLLGLEASPRQASGLASMTTHPSGSPLVSAQPFQGPWWLHSQRRLTFLGKLGSELPTGAGENPRAQVSTVDKESFPELTVIQPDGPGFV